MTSTNNSQVGSWASHIRASKIPVIANAVEVIDGSGFMTVEDLPKDTLREVANVLRYTPNIMDRRLPPQARR